MLLPLGDDDVNEGRCDPAEWQDETFKISLRNPRVQFAVEVFSS